MGKYFLITSSMLLFIVLFQNCGTGFQSSTPAIEGSLSEKSLGSCGNNKVEIPARRMRLLSKNEYTNTVKSILVKLPSGFKESPLEGIYEGYSSFSDDLIVNETVAKIFLDNSLVIARELVSQNMFNIKSCLNNDKSCELSINKMLSKVFRGHPVNSVMTKKYLNFYKGITLQDKNESLIFMVSAAFQSPHFIYRSELGESSNGTYTTLKPYELANELSYLYTHSPPDELLLKDLRENNIYAGSPVLVEHAIRLSTKANTLNTFIEEWLELTDLKLINKTSNLGGESNKVLNALSTELSLVTKKIINNNLSYVDIHSLGKTFVNNQNSKIYSGVSQGGAGFKEVVMDNRIGILNMAPFLAKHSHPDNSNPVHRGGFILGKVLCGEIRFPDNIGSLPEEVEGQNITTRQRVEASTETGSCISCHQYFNGFGFALENFNEWGSFRTKEAGHNINSEASIKVGSDTVNLRDSLDLSSYLGTSSKSRSCFSKNLLKYSLSVASPDECLSRDISSSLGSGTSIKEVFLNVVTSDQFSKRRK